ncbi:RAS1 protein [Dispira simplex]|nr:RAS1 protein [Dispira simplex]
MDTLDSYTKNCEVDGEEAFLDVLDSAGQEEYNVMREQYIQSGDGFLLVYSVTSQASFEEVRILIDQLLRIKGVSQAPVVIVGNKSDLEIQRQVTTEQGRQLAAEYQAMFMETSAKMRTNVSEAFHCVVRQIRHYRTSLSRSNSSTSSQSTTVPPPARIKRSVLSCLIFSRRDSRTVPKYRSSKFSSDNIDKPLPPPPVVYRNAKDAYYQESVRRANTTKFNAHHEDNQSRCFPFWGKY